jgi:hypothetical protein
MAFSMKFFKKSYSTPDTCPICFDNMKNTNTITKCNHTFCNSCLKLWLKNNDSCPLCRTTIRDNIENTHQPVKYRVETSCIKLDIS